MGAQFAQLTWRIPDTQLAPKPGGPPSYTFTALAIIFALFALLSPACVWHGHRMFPFSNSRFSIKNGRHSDLTEEERELESLQIC